MAADENQLRVLSPGVGYGIIIGIGGVFAALMVFITFLQNRYTRFSTHQSEEFNTASRSVKPGLIASGIVSSWTWSATLLTSSTFGYLYGVMGPMFYGALGCFQIVLFALVSVKIKANVPGAHTFPEIMLAFHGRPAHISYLFFGLATNMLVGACLVLGGAQVVEALSGTNVYAANWLIPLVVAAYVIVGGLRSTFIADYIHTLILFVVIFVFGFLMYATSPLVGSPGRFYELLVEASNNMPIAGNVGESYLGFRSTGGIQFAFDLWGAGFTCVFLDQAYWQRAIASRPETTVKAYILGGVAWYGIPFAFATAMGLGCAALTSSPEFPTFPNPLSSAQVGAGLSAPAVTIALLGQSGAILMLILLFMAVTSSTSAELIAVSSLLTFDIYKCYINPAADSKRLVQVSHYGIVIYAVCLAVFCCILNKVGLNLTWLVTVLGVIVGGGAVPVGLTLVWKRMSTVAALWSPWLGALCALVTWFVTTHARSGEITVSTTGEVSNSVAGNITAFGSGAAWAVILTVLFPGKHESVDPKQIEMQNKIRGIKTEADTDLPGESAQCEDCEEKTIAETTEPAKPEIVEPATSDQSQTLRVETKDSNTKIHTGNEVVDFIENSNMQPMDPVLVEKGLRLAWTANIVFFAVGICIVPFSLFGSGWVFNRPFFEGWVVVSFIWAWSSMVICVIYPIVESRNALNEVGRGLWRDTRALLGARRPKV